MGNWHYRISQMYENFKGTNDVNELRFDSTGALDRMTPETVQPQSSTTGRRRSKFYGDLIKDVLRLDFSGRIRHARHHAPTTRRRPSTPTAHRRSSSRNYSGNRHHGDLQRLLGNLRLTYTPNDIWTLWAGIGRKDEDDDNHSVVNVDETLDGVLDGTTVYHNKPRPGRDGCITPARACARWTGWSPRRRAAGNAGTSTTTGAAWRRWGATARCCGLPTRTPTATTTPPRSPCGRSPTSSSSAAPSTRRSTATTRISPTWRTGWTTRTTLPRLHRRLQPHHGSSWPPSSSTAR